MVAVCWSDLSLKIASQIFPPLLPACSDAFLSFWSWHVFLTTNFKDSISISDRRMAPLERDPCSVQVAYQPVKQLLRPAAAAACSTGFAIRLRSFRWLRPYQNHVSGHATRSTSSLCLHVHIFNSYCWHTADTLQSFDRAELGMDFWEVIRATVSALCGLNVALLSLH